MRCLALAQAAKAAGMEPHIAGRVSVPWVRERLQQETIPFTEFSGAVPAQETPEDLLAQLFGSKAGWVVLDGYHFGLDCHMAVREAGYKLLVIDDYNHLPEYSCDILLNQNVGAEALAYDGDLGTKLLGPRYALLRQEFVATREQAMHRVLPQTPQHILVTLGGGDFSTYLEKIAPIFTAPQLVACTLRVIAGAMPEARIRNLLQHCPAKLEILHRVDNMPELFLQADLCITAGGSTCWELCCLGVPFLTVEVAENQHNVVQGLAQDGIAEIFATENFSTLLRDGKAYQTYCARVQQSRVDGKGAMQVLEALTGDTLIQLRVVQSNDSDFVLSVANDSFTRQMSFQQHAITPREHEEWFARQLNSEAPFYIAIYQGKPCGYARFTINNDEAVISMAVAPQFRGKSLGTAIIHAASRRVLLNNSLLCIYAFIKQENTVSRRAFAKAHFVEIAHGTNQETISMKYPGM
jgi:UDP-2,4-diacetamido-2,4,6-trideoxy-beta-L-altropyranose hydrolase